MVFACVFVLVGLENLLYTCIMYVLYIVLVPGTVHVHLYNSMYNIYIYVPWWYIMSIMCTTHTYFSFLLFSRMEKGVCQQLNFEKR
jgi:hypothetical protein